MVPGEILPADSPDVEPNPDAPRVTLLVANTGDRPVQVGSHFSFFETNKALRFDRTAAYGTRLDIPAGTSVRFEPGDEREVTLVALGGHRVVHGFGGLVEGALDDPDVRARALTRVVERGYLTTSGEPA